MEAGAIRTRGSTHTLHHSPTSTDSNAWPTFTATATGRPLSWLSQWFDSSFVVACDDSGTATADGKEGQTDYGRVERRSIKPRPNWKEAVAKTGLTFFTDRRDRTPYWTDDVYYSIDPVAAEALRTAATEVHSLCLAAVERVVGSDELLTKFAIPREAWPAIRESWERRDPTLYGRFDFVFSGGSTPPKMLEYNADTPTCVVESAFTQKQWAEEVFPELTQFNSLAEDLTAQWRVVIDSFVERWSDSTDVLHLSCVRGHEEDLRTTQGMERTAAAAGISTKVVFVEDVGYDSESDCFVDKDNEHITTMFKLYPWEWFMDEPEKEYGVRLLDVSRIRVVEPAWKMVLSNKALLPVLWEMYPNHPNLLPAYFSVEEGLAASPEFTTAGYVTKPLLGREGANVTVFTPVGDWRQPGVYGSEGYVAQAAALPPCADFHWYVFGAWIVGDKAAGVIVREDYASPIINNDSRVAPHIIEAA